MPRGASAPPPAPIWRIPRDLPPRGIGVSAVGAGNPFVPGRAGVPRIVPKEPCLDFAHGRCARGGHCRYNRVSQIKTGDLRK